MKNTQWPRNQVETKHLEGTRDKLTGKKKKKDVTTPSISPQKQRGS